MEAAEDKSDGLHPVCDMFRFGPSATYSLPKKHVEGMHVNNPVDASHTDSISDWYRRLSRSKNDYQLKNCEQKVPQGDLSKSNALLNNTVAVSYHSRSYMPAFQEPLAEPQHLTSQFVSPACMQSQQTSVRTVCDLSCEQSATVEEVMGNKCDAVKNDYHQVQCTAPYRSVLRSTGTALRSSGLPSGSGTWPLSHFGGVSYNICSSLGNSLYDTAVVRNSCSYAHGSREDQVAKSSDLSTTVSDVDQNCIQPGVFSSNYRHIMDAKDSAQNLNGIAIFTDEKPLNESIADRRCDNIDNMQRYPGWHSNVAAEHEITNKMEMLKPLNSPSRTFGRNFVCLNTLSSSSVSLSNSLNYVTMHPHSSVVNIQQLEHANDCALADNEQVIENNVQNVIKESMQRSKYNLTLSNVLTSDDLTQKRVRAETLLINAESGLKDAAHVETLHRNDDTFSGCTGAFEEKSAGMQSTTNVVPLSEQECLPEHYSLDRDSIASDKDVEELDNQVLQTQCMIQSSSGKQDLLKSVENVEENHGVQKWCITDRSSRVIDSLETVEVVNEKKKKQFVQQHCSTNRNSEDTSKTVIGDREEEKIEKYLQTQCINIISDETTHSEIEKDLKQVEYQSLPNPCTYIHSTEEVNTREDYDHPELKVCLQKDCTYRKSEDSDSLEEVHHQKHLIINRSTDELCSPEVGKSLEQLESQCLKRHCTSNQSTEELVTKKTDEVLKLDKQCSQRLHITYRNRDDQDSLKNKPLQTLSIINRSTVGADNSEICQDPELLEKQCVQRPGTFEQSSEELNTQETDYLELENQHLQGHGVCFRNSEAPGNLEKEHPQTWRIVNISTELGSTEICSDLELKNQYPQKHFTFDRSNDKQSVEKREEDPELEQQHFQTCFGKGPSSLESSKEADNLETSERIQGKLSGFKSGTLEVSKELKQSFWRDCTAGRAEESGNWLQGYNIAKNIKQQGILGNESEGHLENQHFQRPHTTDGQYEKHSLEATEVIERLKSQYIPSCTVLYKNTEKPGNLETNEVEKRQENWWLLRNSSEDRNSAEQVCLQTNENVEGGDQYLQRLCPTNRATQELGNLPICEEKEDRPENPGVQSPCTVDRNTEEPSSLEIVKVVSKDQHFPRLCIVNKSTEKSGDLENGEKVGQDHHFSQRNCSTDRISIDAYDLDSGKRVESQSIQRHCFVTRSSEVPANLESVEKQERLENHCPQINCTAYRSSEELGSLAVCENIEENQCLQRYIDERHDEPDRLKTGKLRESPEDHCHQEDGAVGLSVIEETSEELGKELKKHCFQGAAGSIDSAILLTSEPEQDLEKQCLQRLVANGHSKETDDLEVAEGLKEQENLELSFGNSSMTAGPLESTTFHIGCVDLDLEGGSPAADVADTKELCSIGKSGDITGTPEVENSLCSEIKKKKGAQQRTFERKILPPRSTRGMRLEEIVQNITPSRSKASGSLGETKVPLLRSKRLPPSRQSKQTAEEKLRSETFIKNSNDKGNKSLGSKGSLLKKSSVKLPIKSIQVKVSSIKSKKSTVKEPAENSDLTASAAQTDIDSFSLISCPKFAKPEPQTEVLEEIVKENSSKNAGKLQLDVARNQHREMSSKDLCPESSGSSQRLSGEAGKRHNAKRIKRKREQQSLLFLPNEPEIRLKYANYKDERRENKMDSFAPYVKVELRDHYNCTVVNCPEEEPCIKRKKNRSLVVQNYSGAIPSSSCLITGRINNEAKSRGELVCCLCGRSANAGILGDLFGPFYLEGLKQEKPFVNSESSLKLENDGKCWSAQEKNGNQILGGPRTRSSKNSQSSKKDRSKLNNLETVIRSPPTKKMKKEPTLEEWFRPPVVPLESNEYWVHEDCVIWCTNVYIVKGKLYGLAEAAKLAQETMCSQCYKNGATLGCYCKGCSFKYHYICAIEVGCFLNEENFSVRCPKHKDKVLKGCMLIKGER